MTDEANVPNALSVLLSLLPLLATFAVLIYVTWHSGRFFRHNYHRVDALIAEQRRTNAALERIAAALEAGKAG